MSFSNFTPVFQCAQFHVMPVLLEGIPYLLWCSELHYAEKLSVIYSKRQQLRVWNWAPLAEWFPGETWISLHSWVLFEFMLLKWKPARQEIVMKPCKWLFKVYLLICISVMHTHIRTSSYCTVIDSMCLESSFLFFFSPLMCRSLLFLSTRGRKLKGCKIASWCSFSVFL